jgi:hypothetical protein
MPLVFQFEIRRIDAKRNRQNLYVFGDNVARKGYGGQARELRGEPNGIGVATKNAPYDFFGDAPAEVLAQNRIIDKDMKPLFAHLKRGGIVVWPTRGIGSGLAELPIKAPRTYEHLENKLRALIETAKVFHQDQSAMARLLRRICSLDLAAADETLRESLEAWQMADHAASQT